MRAAAVWLAFAVAAVAPAAAQIRTTPPFPFAYVGTLDQDSERYAVLAKRDQSLLLVRAGETINDEYRVQSIAGERLLVVHLSSGAVQTLTLSEPGAPEPASAPPSQLPEVAKEAVRDAPATEPDPDGARPGYAH